MAFALTFGAIGDFISTAALVVDISRALSETKGSKIEYQGLIGDLDVLKTALMQVERSYDNHPQIRELEELLVASESSMRRCREQIEAFISEISKYETTLQPAAKGYRVSSIIAKVRWMHDRDKFRKLKEDLMHCCETLNLHLSATANHMIQRHHRETHAKLAELNRLTVDLDSRSSSHLTTIESHVTKTYLEVVALRQAQMERVYRPLSEEVFTLHDALNREAPVPLRLIDCWDAFQAVLTARFHGRPGQRRVSRGKYIIFDGILGKDIPKGSDWASSFLPGRLIVMSIICQARQLVERPVEGNRCPRCTESSDVTVGSERRW
ncbi:hypothetical protein F5Y08DRAFT_348191 [Xylaria arbuscula]|nr:hypothetical protein F5Y08DRAFT_348191 [Xylaria arbuscula]